MTLVTKIALLWLSLSFTGDVLLSQSADTLGTANNTEHLADDEVAADIVLHDGDSGLPCFLASFNVTLNLYERGLSQSYDTMSRPGEKYREYKGYCGDTESFISVTWWTHPMQLNLTFVLKDLSSSEIQDLDDLAENKTANSSFFWILEKLSFAYHISNDNNSDIVECAGDMKFVFSAKTTIVPFVVAGCLAFAVVFIILAYAICLLVKKRTRKPDYKSME